MDKISAILRTGVKDIRLVAPDPRCSQAVRAEVIRSGFRLIRLSEGVCQAEAGPSSCNLVCYSAKDEAILTSHCLMTRVMPFSNLDASKVRGLYEWLCARSCEPVSIKTMMRDCGIGNFYKARELFKLFSNSGLFCTVGRQHLLPYYYKGCDRLSLVVRHLLSLGWEAVVEGGAVRASMGRSHMVVGFDMDEVAAIRDGDAAILICGQRPYINFCGMRSYTLDSFLKTSCLLTGSK